jgi:hypothetical protein
MRFVIEAVILTYIVTTVCLLLEIYVAKNHISFQDTITRYISASIIGSLFGLFIYGMPKPKIEKLRILLHSETKKPLKLLGESLPWLKTSLFFGIVSFGLGAGTFFVLTAKFILRLPIVKISHIIIAYIIWVRIGLIAASVIYIGGIIAKLVVIWKPEILKIHNKGV